MKAAALRGALSDRARHGRIHVVSSLSTATRRAPRARSRCSPRSARASTCSSSPSATTSVSWKSLRNAHAVHMLSPGQLNTYDVLVSDDVVFTESALQAFLAPSPRAGAPRPAPAPAEAVARPVPAAADECRTTRARTRPARHRERRPIGRQPRSSRERPDRPARHPAVAGHLREELRPARREQVHVPRPPGRQQDPDQDRGREGLRRQGQRRQHAQPPGQAQAHAGRLRSARRPPSARSSRCARAASRSSGARSPSG